MRVEQLRQLWTAEPFRPFTIHLAEGRELKVRHKEFLAVAPSGRSIVLYQPDDSFNVVDLLLVTDLEVPGNGKSNGTPRRKRKRD